MLRKPANLGLGSRALKRLRGVVASSGAASFRPDTPYEDGDLTLFQTGAIVVHAAQRYRVRLPADPHAREQAIPWMFAALSTIEPPILELTIARMFEKDTPWAQERLPLVEDRARMRLVQLAVRLGRVERLDACPARAISGWRRYCCATACRDSWMNFPPSPPIWLVMRPGGAIEGRLQRDAGSTPRLARFLKHSP